MNRIADYLNNKSILLLGFGREGQSSYHFIRKYLKNNPICIADKNIHLDKSSFADEHLNFVLGDNYLDNINDFDIVLKSRSYSPGPGFTFFIISFSHPEGPINLFSFA